MRNIQGKVSKIEKTVRDRFRSDNVERFLVSLGYPENVDLFLLGIEGIVIQILVRTGRISEQCKKDFLDRLRAYCEGETAKVWDKQKKNLLLNRKLNLDSAGYMASKPSKPLNFYMVVRSLGLERGDKGEKV